MKIRLGIHKCFSLRENCSLIDVTGLMGLTTQNAFEHIFLHLFAATSYPHFVRIHFRIGFNVIAHTAPPPLFVIWVVTQIDRHKYPMSNNRDHLVGQLTINWPHPPN